MEMTALEGFSKELKLLLLEKDTGLDIMFFMKKYNEILEQAKEIEMQQIIMASATAYEDMFGNGGMEYGENYYNKTFKLK